MTPTEIDAFLARSFEDRRLSRGERQALTALLAPLGPMADLAAIRRRAFQIAREHLSRPEGCAALDWLEAVVKTLHDEGHAAPPPVLAEAYFSPGDECPSAILRLLRQARRSLSVCVFTITDDRLADALTDAHRRGVPVRIVTDNAKAEDLGSDIERFEAAGMAVRVDRSPYHMHHKFAIIDGTTLLTGSYNWTRGAARDNEENLIVTDEPRFVARFTETFERLWEALG